MTMDTSKPLTLEAIAKATDAELATLNTRHALVLHHRFRLAEISDSLDVEYGFIDAMDPNYSIAINRLKALLDSRPHVPNRKEAKKARQLAAKRKK